MAELAQRNVPFFDYPNVFTGFEAEYTRIFQEIGRRGAFIEQKECREFEKALAAYTGSKYCLGVANCTDGLTIALRAAGIGPGDEVLFTSHTFVATAASIVYAGATPVPVECRPDHMMDPESAARAITPRTRAIMPTQLNGRTCDMDKIKALADRHNLILMEDAAQGLGSKFKGRQAGTFGLASAISFYPAKNLGALGDAGAILTDDAELYAKMALLKDHGRNHEGEVVVWGMNSRLDNLQAAFLTAKLARYDGIVEERRRFAGIYQELLGGLNELVLPPAPDSDPNHFDVFQNYEIEAERRDELKAHLKANGVGTLIQWNGKAVHQFKGLGLQQKLPYTDGLFPKLLMLPMSNTMTEDDVKYVSQCVRRFYRG